MGTPPHRSEATMAADAAFVKEVYSELLKGDERMDHLQEQLHAVVEALRSNTEAQLEMKKTHDDIMEVYKGIKAAIKVFGVVERIALFITKVTAAGAVVWASWRFVFKETLERL